VAWSPASWASLSLDTERLRLRPPTAEDADSLREMLNDPEVWGDRRRTTPVSEEEAHKQNQGWLQRWENDGIGGFVIETHLEGQVVGRAGLMVFDSRTWTPSSFADAGVNAQPELGWALIRAHWGNGYATEAAAAIRDWGRTARDIDRLISFISPDNVRSQRVAQRLGAKPTATVSRGGVAWEHPQRTRQA
jgi:RimJ/RimL family protein N-acetyltransferase